MQGLSCVPIMLLALPFLLSFVYNPVAVRM